MMDVCQGLVKTKPGVSEGAGWPGIRGAELRLTLLLVWFNSPTDDIYQQPVAAEW